MAKDLSSATGIGTSADYLNGNLVPVVTVASVDINQDMVQFFQKLMSEAGLAANGDFDNEVNGYQFIEALKKVVVSPKIIISVDNSGTLLGSKGIVDVVQSDIVITGTGLRTINIAVDSDAVMLATIRGGSIGAIASNIFSPSGYIGIDIKDFSYSYIDAAFSLAVYW